ncbi:MAG TPA: metallophosphoesterase [Actinospica sp.]|nr:metallophosphoesterase [Actinospica sp.]
MIFIAQLSDLHVDGSDRAAERVTRAMDALRALTEPPAALLVTGDVADGGSEAQYAEVLRLTEAPFPVYFCPGNHDDRAAFRSVLLGEQPDPASQEGPVNRAHKVGALTVLMCDSTLPGKNEGLLDPGTLAWIEKELDALGPDASALLAFHHPPVPVHVPMLDVMLLQNPDALAELLARRPEIVGVVNGHTHTAAASALAGRPVLLCPAVTWTLRLSAQGGPMDDRDDAPGIAFHCIAGRQLTTHFRSAR